MLILEPFGECCDVCHDSLHKASFNGGILVHISMDHGDQSSLQSVVHGCPCIMAKVKGTTQVCLTGDMRAQDVILFVVAVDHVDGQEEAPSIVVLHVVITEG